jgi:AraC-like DNA-binding protein
VRGAYLAEFGSADLEEEFFELYEKNERALQQILGTSNKIAIMSGEAMSILWGALKSTTERGSKLLCVANGLFSSGFGEMGQDIGLDVETLDFGLNGIPDFNKVRDAARRFRPDVITAVHCETPSGTLTPLKELGEISSYHPNYLLSLFKRENGVTPYQYILRLRMQKARALLRAGVRVGEVACTVGFSDASSFSRAFGLLYGLTPRQFARRGNIVP